jgi:hypothetical protein
MLNPHKRTPATPQEQERLARDIAACTSFIGACTSLTGATDREIDNLVYEL